MEKNLSNQITLLLVEDSPADVYLVKEAIRQEGLEVHIQIAHDGEQVLSLIDKIDENCDAACPSALLLDLNLRGRRGRRFSRECGAARGAAGSRCW